ncbi:four-carbon acid sugar kinase family protein [Bacillus sp. DTU_2020_1000418_1_SI_GHA_SEK_038]|uniref:four-carbon acid sugar kinase family protein n=1 Tax=Bacillus sp. DTU_2020_1000418_1_SI_GHA_SEK_038 TaxID=3077585 RepID=UPI0028ED6361|nr:four-carbon acid sugar kinase family protein [Bacillus sp. DTU_2020_1000418_1_SI_GHA_SEK_038]WNS76310.1 four-carbon acid sugar kinase family protein [Bacillus sp. DTU_2020_1000418_1_SI_GHA_SEK_038]
MEWQKADEVIASYPPIDKEAVRKLWTAIRPSFDHKIIVLDDDPTGVQTVHNVSVFTDWSEDTIEHGFQDDAQMFFILTNSRAFTAKETEQVHRDIAERVEKISKKYDRPFILISRGDSTLRGHYPLETEVMRHTIENNSGAPLDGEVLIPFFKEGGRLTINDIHYVQQGNALVPAGETEFAKDRTFGYHSSHLGEWIEEKTGGQFSKENVTYISLQSLRQMVVDDITEQLMKVSNFGKVVVNAIEEEDLIIFSCALIQAIQKGKQFLFRTAAAFTKVIGDISSRPLLERSELITEEQKNGGLVIVGSHVKKTTDQLQALKSLSSLHFIELNVHLVLDKPAFLNEVKRAKLEAEQKVSEGVTTVIYTRRERLDLGEGMEEEELKLSVEISNAVTSIVSNFAVRPNYIIGKGGITSSDIGTKGLKVKRAAVAGQIAPGVPVWKTGDESTFPHIPYIIFPGNVGTTTTLKEVVLCLEGK